MKPLQFSLRSLLLAVTLISLGCAALAYPTPGGFCVVISVTVLVLAIALLRAVVLGRKAGFSMGLATIGWLYMLLVFSPWQIGAVLLTNRGLIEVAGYRYQVVGSRPRPGLPLAIGLSGERIWLWDRTLVSDDDDDGAAFCLSAHPLAALLFGLFGGLLSRSWLSAQGKTPQADRNLDPGG